MFKNSYASAPFYLESNHVIVGGGGATGIFQKIPQVNFFEASNLFSKHKYHKGNSSHPKYLLKTYYYKKYFKKHFMSKQLYCHQSLNGFSPNCVTYVTVSHAELYNTGNLCSFFTLTN